MTRKFRKSLSSLFHATLVGSYLRKQIHWEMRHTLPTRLEFKRTTSLPTIGLSILGVVIILCAIYSFWRKKKLFRVSQNHSCERKIPLCAIHSWGRKKPSYSTLCRRGFYSLTSPSNLDVNSHMAGHLTQSTWISIKKISEPHCRLETNLSQLLLLLSGDVESNPGPPTTTNNGNIYTLIMYVANY